MKRRLLEITPYPAVSPAVGRLLGMLEDTRRRTLNVLEGAQDADLDWKPARGGDTVGSLLYHIAIIETSWLYDEVLVQPAPDEIAALFALDARDEQGRLSYLGGESLATHLARLDTVRQALLAAFARLDADDLRRVRTLPDYDVTPEWVLHHLLQHEAEHRSQIDATLRSARAEATGE